MDSPRDSAHSSTRVNTALPEQADVYNFSPTGMSLRRAAIYCKRCNLYIQRSGGVPKVFCEQKLDCSKNIQNNAGRQLTRGQDDKNVSEARRLRKHSTNTSDNASIANGFLRSTAMLRSVASATHTTYSLSEPKHANTKKGKRCQ